MKQLKFKDKCIKLSAFNKEELTDVIRIKIKDNYFAGDLKENNNINRSQLVINKNGKHYDVLKKFDQSVNNDNNNSIWQADITFPAGVVSLNLDSILTEEQLNDITDETAAGGDAYDGSNRTILCYFLGNDTITASEPIMLPWTDNPVVDENVKSLVTNAGFTPISNSPYSGYNLDSDHIIRLLAVSNDIKLRIAKVDTPYND